MSYDDDDDVTNDLTPTFLNPADFPEGTTQTFRIARAEKRTYDSGGKWTLIFHDDQCLSLNAGNLRLVALVRPARECVDWQVRHGLSRSVCEVSRRG